MIAKKRFGFWILLAALFAFPVLAQNPASQGEAPDARWAEQFQKVTALQDRLLARELEYGALAGSDKIDRKEIRALIDEIVELKGQIRSEWEKLHPRRDARWGGPGGWRDSGGPGWCGCPRGRMGGW